MGCRGHLGLASFHSILTDSRTQRIPLVLETPNYDDDLGVWAAEVDILNRLSTLSLSADGPSRLSTPSAVEDQLRIWTEEIRAAVKKARAAKDAKQAKSAARKQSKSRKGPKDDAGEDGEDEEQGIDTRERKEGELSDLSELSDLTAEEEAQLVDENRTL